MTIDFKSCPFCDGTDIRSDRHVSDRSPTREIWSMCCYDCGATFPNRYKRDLLVAAWNRRPDNVDRLKRGHAEMIAALKAIMRATIEGRVCDDVAWFDQITTLHDFLQVVDAIETRPPEDQTRLVDCECDGEGCATCQGVGRIEVETTPATQEDVETNGS